MRRFIRTLVEKLSGTKKKDFNMKKYVIAKTGEEVKLGDVIAYDNERKTSFGIMKTHISYTIIPLNIDSFLEKGIIKCIDIEEKEEDNIGYYIDILAKKLGYTSDELVDWLEKVNKVCPKAVFEILEKTIADEFAKASPKEYLYADKFYGIRLSDGKAGMITGNNVYIPKFASLEDVEKARTLLKDQLNLMYGK